MMVAAPDDPGGLEQDWNPEREDLAFLRDEGLELLALFRSIKDKDKRQLIVELIRIIAGDQAKR